MVLTDKDFQIHGFTHNCWETFGFKPRFFFNKFGDPTPHVRMTDIIRTIRDPEEF